MPVGLAGWLTYLEQLHPKTIALGLDRVSQVRDRLALQYEFPVILVAGTNGKGSTCAMLERIYLEAGYRVACYTSPHLLRYNERVRVNGLEIEDEALCDAFAAVEAVRGDTPLTYFEFGTLAAMWHFVQTGVDVAVLEVGLGGRLDAVNIFEPACAIVTSVDLDHVDYLGHTRESIATEKAGVYRPDVPAICGDPEPPATLVRHARDIAAQYRQVGEHFHFQSDKHAWCYLRDGLVIESLPQPALNGHFQFYNAACVVDAVQCLQSRLPVDVEAIRAGLRQVRLPGRFQTLSLRPHVILDVAHNPHAAKGLAENLRAHPVAGKTVAVCAMLADKDVAGVMQLLAPVVDVWCMASIHAPRGAQAGYLADQLATVADHADVSVFDDVKTAFRQACLGVGENDRIIVFGSFYTVADVMHELPKTFG